MMKRLLILPLILLAAACGPVDPPTQNPLQPTVDAQNTQIAQLQTSTAVVAVPTTATFQPPSTTPVLPTATATPTNTPVLVVTPDSELQRAIIEEFDAENGEFFNALDNPIQLEIGASGPKSFSPVYELSALADDFALRFEVTLGDHINNECLVEFGNEENFIKTGERVAGEDERRFLVFYRQGSIGYVDVTWYSLDGWRSVQNLQSVNLQVGTNTTNTVIFIKNGSLYSVNVNGQTVTFTDSNPVTPGPIFLNGAVNAEVSNGTLTCVFQNVQWYIPVR